MIRQLWLPKTLKLAETDSMSAALRTPDLTGLVSRNRPALEEPRILQPIGDLSPRLSELLDWLNREWDEKSEHALYASFADSG